jgi:hypothetical protein
MIKTTRKLIPGLFFAGVFLMSMTLFSNSARAEQAKAQKEWTFLLFLNGNNNLDYFGAYNINQMEEVGSNENLNMVVQWASIGKRTTKRLLVTKDNDTKNVTSKTIEDLGNIDMGDYKQLVNFIEWGAKNFPAKHYMVAVWNHGNGWQILNLGAGAITRDISYDDNTGNKITTEELGLAMSEAAKIIGQPIDIYGSDACLMAMAEVASEMKDSVSYFVGSQDLEPGYGWPYNTFMKRWAANPKATPAEVSTYLSEEYIKAYSGGIYGKEDVTFSSIDMSKYGAFTESLKNLSQSLASLGSSEITKTKAAVSSTLGFYTPEYKDIVDFVDNLGSSRVGVNSAVLKSVKDTASAMTVYGVGTGTFKKAKGISVWIPSSAYELNSYRSRYSNFEFNKSSNWLAFLDALN